MEQSRFPEQVNVPLTYEGTRFEKTGEEGHVSMQNMHGQGIVEPRVRLFPEPLPVHGNANHSHSRGYAAELRIKTDVTGVGYPCLKQLARAVHSKAEAGLRAELIKENFMSTQQILVSWFRSTQC